MRVAAVQMQHAPADKEANFETMERFVAQAAGAQVQLIVFPECCVSGYWFIRKLSIAELTSLAEPVPDGPSATRLAGMARQYRMAIGAGWIERAPAETFYNTYVVALPDGSIHAHRKLHAFEHPAIHSGTAYTIVPLPNGLRAGVLICYDCNIVENVRITALQGADLLLAPHQTGGVASRDRHQMGVIDRALWENRVTHPEAIEAEFRGDKGRGWLMRWLPSRAHDNGIFLIFSNGVGIDDDEIRTGNAMILDPYGRTLAETHSASDAVVIADLDLSLLGASTGARWLQARRPELYTPLTVRTGLERDTHDLKFEE
jgi:predicted amidohydrolase